MRLGVWPIFDTVREPPGRCKQRPSRVADNAGAAAGGELLAAPQPRMRGIGSSLGEDK